MIGFGRAVNSLLIFLDRANPSRLILHGRSLLLFSFVRNGSYRNRFLANEVESCCKKISRT